MSDIERPATPFIFIPKDYSARPGVEGDPNNVGWITGPAIYLINDQRRFEPAPRYGVNYRILALVGNAGAVPAQQAFVEFNLGMPPRNQLYPLHYIEDPIDLDQFASHLGVAVLSIPQAVDSRTLSWALSPKSHSFQWDPAEYTAVVKAGELLHDRPPKTYASRIDRHTAFRPLMPNFSGIWEGIEEDVKSGQAVGPVKLEITQKWDVAPTAGGATIPSYTIIPRQLTALADRPVHLDQPYTDHCDTQISFTIDDGKSPDQYWYAVLTPRFGDTLEMRIDKNEFPDATRGRLLLHRTGAGTPSPEIDKNMLEKVRLNRVASWPTSRLEDFEVLREAIMNL